MKEKQVDFAKIKAWLNLVDTKKIGYKSAFYLAQNLGEPCEYVGTYDNRLEDISFLDKITIANLSQPKEPNDWENIRNLMEKYDIKFVSILDEEYPKMLKQIYDPPLYLFYRGTLTKEDCRRGIGVVGTRKASNYGKLATQKIVKKLASSGMTIVSGLAYGIDSVAHKSTLEVNGRTIAVIATGCEQVYPVTNRDLALQILENGAIVSEFRPGSPLDRWKFVQRNRIISGMSLGTLVIEGSKKSGALLTADFAMNQNRDVFALPGDISREQSAGPNYLIKNGAIIVTSANDILDEYNLHNIEDGNTEFPDLSEEEELVYQTILENKPEIEFDVLLIKTKLSIGQLSTIILMLEMKSVIKKMASNKYAALI